MYKMKGLIALENELMVAKGRDSEALGEDHVHIAIFKMNNKQTYCKAHGILLFVILQTEWRIGLERRMDT